MQTGLDVLKMTAIEKWSDFLGHRICVADKRRPMKVHVGEWTALRWTEQTITNQRLKCFVYIIVR